MSDNDLIRRGDARRIALAYATSEGAERADNAIAALTPAQPDPAAIREAALREAAEVCAGIRQRIANGPMPEGARFDYEQAILALIAKGAAE